ncbi:hypothetical protein PVNG_02146 [Plasmodium vivax North Korean]|uniref:Variable surface protein Vir7-like protein n=1 Tax=Plasmodium vivax North Korean TaxID=1035514 RepID=A0A0J9WDP4_PLAVI|nr:hypothetical protein PVNG_02146 [Plasmodium vivax North Korean]
MDSSQDNHQIITVCDRNETYRTEPTEKYKTICKHLLKNLKILSSNNYSNADTFYTACKNLNNWLYFKENEHSVSNDIINDIFQAYKQIKNETFHKNDCAYSTFDNGFNEQEKLINLRIFNDNGEAILGLLKKNNKSDDCSLKRYVYKCIEVYRAMYKSYSFHLDCNRSQYKNACNIINEFKQLYSAFIYKNGGIHHDFPELSSNTPTNNIDGCPSEEIESNKASPVPSSQSNRSIIQSVPPALGVMAGIPPFLALIYNVNIIFTKIS